MTGPSFDDVLARDLAEHLGDIPQRNDSDAPEREDWRDEPVSDYDLMRYCP